MKKSKKIITLLCIVIIYTCISCGQSQDKETSNQADPISSILVEEYISNFDEKSNVEITLPKHFVKTAIPESNSIEWRDLNHSDNEFQVQNINEKLIINKTRERNICELPLPKGKLKGINRGEFGGFLQFIPSNTRDDTIEIKRGNVNFLFDFKNSIYFIEGLAHMSYSGGALYKLDTSNNNFRYKEILKFDDAPEAFEIHNDKFLIATHENFYVVEDFQPKIVFKETFWSSLYPSSIAAFDEKNVFVGIRGGIVKLNLVNKEMIFFKYKK